jgi:hypothetical protein
MFDDSLITFTFATSTLLEHAWLVLLPLSRPFASFWMPKASINPIVREWINLREREREKEFLGVFQEKITS